MRGPVQTPPASRRTWPILEAGLPWAPPLSSPHRDPWCVESQSRRAERAYQDYVMVRGSTDEPTATQTRGAPPRARLAQRLAHLVALDVSPLRRHRDYRLLYSGQLVSFFGTMVTSVAVPYQAYALTRSPLAVGLF